MPTSEAARRKRHRRVDIRRTHPSFYHALMTFGLVEIALALNFWLGPPPTFNPYDMPKNLVGGVFFLLGVTLMVFLNVLRDLRKVRLVLAASIGFTFFWGIANTQQGLAGKASFQLPILFIGLCVAQVWWLIEAPVNPMTERDK